MIRMVFISCLLVLLVLGCNKNAIKESSKDIPAWLQDKINSMSNERSYGGVKIYRYKWNGEQVYYIDNPISSCMYCELYNQSGNHIKIADNDTQFIQFLGDKSNAVIIWKWADKL
jgi:hypothetical protein